ncbi:uncharacterized protein LOC124272472 [Haliotis rubra]|uniref:uncharacterized protein LOC124272472 n=1 Tax=Haliotis rubra TaxID=36100 RepID=UPI001EE5C73D|nr:uncharacterized protein LOC124272472 [Haliotis rubra]
MTTTEDDGIEILSCHIENEDDVIEQTTTVNVSVTNTKLEDDPATIQRKRVARAVAIVSFVLLLFSVVLIGVSLNMSKNIDDLDANRSFARGKTWPPRKQENPVRESNELLRKQSTFRQHSYNKPPKTDHNSTTHTSDDIMHID